MDCRKFLTDENYVDIFIRYTSLIDKNLENPLGYCITRVNDKWSVLNASATELPSLNYNMLSFASIPQVYGLQDFESMETTGVFKVRQQPALRLTGKGVLIGIVDTGINFTHEVFVNEDGSSRIEYLWDQTETLEEEERIGMVPGNRTVNAMVPFGRVYTNSDINEALVLYLAGENPDKVVAEKDVEGHGTFLAGIAAGNEKPDKEFSGAAPGSGIAVVKLKQAKQYLRKFYLVKDDVPCYSETDILFGVKCLNEYAELVGKPISIIIGVGSNLGGHEGTSVLADYLNDIGGIIGRSVCVAAGNYANDRLHFHGVIRSSSSRSSVKSLVNSVEKVEIHVDKASPTRKRVDILTEKVGFMCSMWWRPPENYTIGISSPSGQIEKNISLKTGRSVVLDFPLEGSKIELFYGINEGVSGQNFIVMKFYVPSEGIWTINVTAKSEVKEGYDIWLNNKEFLWSDTYFLKPDPFATLTEVGNSMVPITVGAYNQKDGGIYLGSGRGYTADNRVKPDIVAPGVNVMGPSGTRDNLYVQRTGTSVAVAIAGGCCALMLEYGIVEQNLPFMRTYSIKNYFIAGAKRNTDYVYPDAIFGYGYLDVFGAIESELFD